MPKRTKSKKKRSFKRKGNKKIGIRRVTIKDTYHFHGRASGGELQAITYNAGNPGNTGGVFVIRLPNLAIYNQFSANFEFVRLNKCVLEFLPKFNMTMSANTSMVNPSGPNITGTLVTAIDEQPLFAGTNVATAVTWEDDTTSGGGGPLEAWSISTSMPSPQYVRSIQNSKETEIYKKQTRVFQPKFYTVTLGAAGQALPTLNPGGGAFSQLEMHGKKWVNTKYSESVGTTASGQMFQSLGPIYYGCMYNLMIETAGITATPVYDIRFKYGISFRRLSTLT